MTRPVADGSDVLTAVRDAVRIVLELDPETVTRSSRLVEDLRADSLALVEIIEILEEQLAPTAPSGFRIDDEAFDAVTTVGDVVDHLTGLLRGAPA